MSGVHFHQSWRGWNGVGCCKTHVHDTVTDLDIVLTPSSQLAHTGHKNKFFLLEIFAYGTLKDYRGAGDGD